jgi:hypothetical protein
VAVEIPTSVLLFRASAEETLPRIPSPDLAADSPVLATVGFPELVGVVSVDVGWISLSGDELAETIHVAELAEPPCGHGGYCSWTEVFLFAALWTVNDLSFEPRFHPAGTTLRSFPAPQLPAAQTAVCRWYLPGFRPAGVRTEFSSAKSVEHLATGLTRKSGAVLLRLSLPVRVTADLRTVFLGLGFVDMNDILPTVRTR